MLDENDLEFLEIHNPTRSGVALAGWQVRGGIEFDFADTDELPAGETLVILSFNPNRSENADRTAAFRHAYGLDADVRLLGGYAGSLGNGGETVQLVRRNDPSQSDPPDALHVVVDEVSYDDQAPWPSEADGDGRSLTRRAADAAGNSAESWTASVPTPGTVNFRLRGDSNLDGVLTMDDITDFVLGLMDPAAYERKHGVSANQTGDVDRDGDLDFDDIDELLSLLV
jgi:hypothetical protein